MLIELYWDKEDLESHKLIETEVINIHNFKELLDEYRESDDEYNVEGLVDFLNKKGIKSKLISADECIYF